MSTKTTFKFHKVVQKHCSGKMGTPILLCGKFIQDTMYRILSESSRFCRRSDKHFGLLFFGHSVYTDTVSHIVYTLTRLGRLWSAETKYTGDIRRFKNDIITQ